MSGVSGRIEQALADCLERIESGELSREEALHLYPELRAELEPAVGLAAELRALPKIVAPASLKGYKRPAFRPAPIRESWWRRLLPAPAPSFGWASPIAQAAAVVAAVVVLGSGSVVASANSLPDEPLYPVKLAVENAQLALAPTDVARAELELHLASKRLAEVETAASQGRSEAVAKGVDLYREKLDAATKASGTAIQADPQSEETLRQNVDALNKVLEQVKNPRAQAAVSTAIARTEAVDASKELNGGKPNGKASKPEEKQAAPAPVLATATPVPTVTVAPAAATPTATQDTHEPPGQAKRQTDQQPGNSDHQGQPVTSSPATQQDQEQRGQGQGQQKHTPTVQNGPTATPIPTHTATADQPAQQNTDVSRGNGQQKKVEPEATDPPGNGQKKGAEKSNGPQKDFISTIVENIQNFVRGGKK